MRTHMQTLGRISRCVAAAGLAAFSMHHCFAQSEPGVSDDEVYFGQSTVQSGPLAKYGYDSSFAAKSYFDHINATGGIHGRKIRLVTLDDGDDVKQAVANTKQLIENERVFALFNMAGTATNLAIMPLISAAGIPNIAPDSGAEALRKPMHPLVFNVRASYADEAEVILKHLAIRGIGKLALLAENSDLGKDGLKGIEQGLKELKLKLEAVAQIEYNGADAEKAAQTLEKFHPQAIIMLSGTQSSVEFIHAYSRLAKGTQFFTLSVMGTVRAVETLGKEGVGVVVAQAVPYPFSATSGLVREYQAVMAQMQGRNWSFRSMESYISAKVAVEGLRRAGRKLTRERYLAALESIGKIDLDGYPLSFSKLDHHGSKFVDLTVISKNGGFLR